MSEEWTLGIVGWVACDYTQGDYCGDVAHSKVYETATDASTLGFGNDNWYEGVRYVDYDGYLYVDKPEVE